MYIWVLEIGKLKKIAKQQIDQRKKVIFSYIGDAAPNDVGESMDNEMD
jgi:hypothetical protein